MFSFSLLATPNIFSHADSSRLFLLLSAWLQLAKGSVSPFVPGIHDIVQVVHRLCPRLLFIHTSRLFVILAKVACTRS